jgi:hypothetical protein
MRKTEVFIFKVGETGTDQQVAQLHDRYMMMMMELLSKLSLKIHRSNFFVRF